MPFLFHTSEAPVRYFDEYNEKKSHYGERLLTSFEMTALVGNVLRRASRLT